MSDLKSALRFNDLPADARALAALGLSTTLIGWQALVGVGAVLLWLVASFPVMMLSWVHPALSSASAALLAALAWLVAARLALGTLQRRALGPFYLRIAGAKEPVSFSQAPGAFRRRVTFHLATYLFACNVICVGVGEVCAQLALLLSPQSHTLAGWVAVSALLASAVPLYYRLVRRLLRFEHDGLHWVFHSNCVAAAPQPA